MISTVHDDDDDEVVWAILLLTVFQITTVV